MLAVLLFAGLMLPALTPNEAVAIPLKTPSISATLAAATEPDDEDKDDDDDSTHCMISSLSLITVLGGSLWWTSRRSATAGLTPPNADADQ